MCANPLQTGPKREPWHRAFYPAVRDHLELLHLQAWYFQVRHFPRLVWVRLHPPDGEYFITSDRSVAWLADGHADTPPSALRHPTAQVVSPLTRSLALVGRHGAAELRVTPREVNRFIAFAASGWIAGPTADVVRQALLDRRDLDNELSVCFRRGLWRRHSAHHHRAWPASDALTALYSHPFLSKNRRGHQDIAVSTAASEPAVADGVAGILAFQEELLVGHDGLVRMKDPRGTPYESRKGDALRKS
jgi:hypothetical protein